MSAILASDAARAALLSCCCNSTELICCCRELRRPSREAIPYLFFASRNDALAASNSDFNRADCSEKKPYDPFCRLIRTCSLNPTSSRVWTICCALSGLEANDDRTTSVEFFGEEMEMFLVN